MMLLYVNDSVNRMNKRNDELKRTSQFRKRIISIKDALFKRKRVHFTAKCTPSIGGRDFRTKLLQIKTN